MTKEYFNLTFTIAGYKGDQGAVCDAYYNNHGHDKGQKMWTIYLATERIGLNCITFDNYKEFYKRGMSLGDSRFSYTITLEDIKDLIGLQTNAPVITDEEFYSQPPKKTKVKTCDLKDKELDFVVAHLEEIDVDADCYGFDEYGNPQDEYSPSTEWAEAGPIIERENIAITGISFPWFATEMGWWGHIKDVHLMGRTPLVAAMRTYVASKLGEEVDMDTVYESLQVEIGDTNGN